MVQLACPSFRRAFLLTAIAVTASAAVVRAQNPNDTIKDHRTTEVYEPVPPVVTPGAHVGDAPSDAIVLFDGKNEDEWVKVSDGTAANWKVADGVLTVEKTAGNIQTKRTFTNYQLHIE